MEFIQSAEEWNAVGKSLEKNRDLHWKDVSQRAWDVAYTAFKVAAEYNPVFSMPHPIQLNLWAQLYECTADECRHWLTPELAERAVRAHFATNPEGGHMLPAVVTFTGATLLLEDEANGGES